MIELAALLRGGCVTKPDQFCFTFDKTNDAEFCLEFIDIAIDDSFITVIVVVSVKIIARLDDFWRAKEGIV